MLFRCDQTARLCADQILPSCLFQCRQHQLAVLGQIILEQRTLHGFFFGCFRDIDRLHGVGVQLRVVHTSGNRSRRGVEVLHLFRMDAVVPEKQGQLYRLLEGAAGVGGHEIGDEILLFADALGDLVEPFLKRLIALDVGLSHFVSTTLLTCSGATFS